MEQITQGLDDASGACLLEEITDAYQEQTDGGFWRRQSEHCQDGHGSTDSEEEWARDILSGEGTAERVEL